MEIVALVLGVALGAVGLRFLASRRSRTSTGASRRRGPVDPFTVSDPWRAHVKAALSAQRRFEGIVSGMSAGPLQDRMRDIGRQVSRSVDECADIARHGDRLDDTIRSLDGAALQRQLSRVSDESTADSLRSQIAALDRIREQRNETDERLRNLATRLGELVTQAAEVSTGVDHTSELGSGVDEVVMQLEALGLAVREVDGRGSSGQGRTGSSGAAT